jgi:very-short-patch-repair endonuclease
MGPTSRTIESRIARGVLHLIHRGVYLLGHRAATWRALELAAVLACGAGAVLSHLSAARFWKLLSYPAEPGSFDITVAGRSRRQRESIRLHTDALERRDWMVRDGIPVTNPQRTLLDLAAQVGEPELAAAVNEAHVQRFVTPAILRRLIDAYPGRTGIRALRRLSDDPRMTRSPPERRFLALLRDRHLPLPEANRKLAGHEVDFLWAEQRLVVETDGWSTHSSPQSFEGDRRRDAELAAEGYRVVRVTRRRLVEDEAGVATLIAGALAASPSGTGDSG